MSMIKRVRKTVIGDVFCAKINDKQKRYLQYVVSDLAQLNSDVIRVFKEVYPIDANPDLSEIVSGEIEFYSHCDTKAGIKKELWEKVGNTSEIGNIEQIIFKSKEELKRPDIHDWWVWRVNGNRIRVGELKGEYKNAHIGFVFQVDNIMHKLKTGSYPGAVAQLE